MAYKENIHLISDGELVNAAVSNRAVGDLHGNVEYLRRLFEESLLGSTVYARNQTVADEVSVGQPVWFNPANNRFERARAAATVDSSGALILSPESHVWGILTRKITTASGDILLKGTTEVDLSAAIQEDVVPGLYYLSSTPGRLVRQIPPVSIPILLVGEDGGEGTYRVCVDVQWRSPFNLHQHFRLPLVCLPAGDHTPPSMGDPHEITNPQADMEGWLPADHAVFNGNAPDGANFGYNISAAPFSTLWPPLPTHLAYLEWHRGTDQDHLGMSVPLGSDGLAVVDENGIWWMTNCYDSAPWPTDYDSSISISPIDPDACPVELMMRLILWYAKPVFHTSETAVLSLQPAADSPLRFYQRNSTTPATTGNLEADLDWEQLIDDTNDLSGYALKGVEDGVLQRGPVVSGIRSGSPNVQITGEDIGEDYQAGLCTVTADLGFDASSIPVQTVRLNGATEEYYRGVLAIGFGVQRSGVACRLFLPSRYELPAGAQLALRFRVLARLAGSLPAEILTVEYRRLPQPAAVLTPVDLPTTDTPIAMETAVAVGADQYVDMQTEPFDVAAGDVVLFTMERDAPDGYNGPIYLIEKHGLLIL